MATYGIGKLASLSGIGIETIRYYEREGLIPEPPRTGSGYRVYPEEILSRLRFIRNAKELGFSLRDIRELLGLRVAPGSSCADVRKRAEAKIVEVRDKLEILRRMEAALLRLTAACRGNGPRGSCPIIDMLEDGNETQ